MCFESKKKKTQTGEAFCLLQYQKIQTRTKLPAYLFTPNPLLAGHHVKMAKEHDALLVALEHRFYGDSINADGLKKENLASLSSKQASVLAGK